MIIREGIWIDWGGRDVNKKLNWRNVSLHMIL